MARECRHTRLRLAHKGHPVSRVVGVCSWRGFGEKVRFAVELRLELALDVVERLFVAGRADIAALEFVVGEKLHVRPPGLAFGLEIRRLGGVRRGQAGGDDQKRRGQGMRLHHATLLPRLVRRT